LASFFCPYENADALGTLSCKPSNFRKRIRKVINKASEVGVEIIKKKKIEVK
jgi:hypothetical protein